MIGSQREQTNKSLEFTMAAKQENLETLLLWKKEAVYYKVRSNF